MNRPRKHKRTDRTRDDLSAKVCQIDQWSTFAHPEHHKALLWKILRKGYYDLALLLLKRVQEIDERDIDSARVYTRYLTKMYIRPRIYKPKVNQETMLASIKYLVSNYPELTDEIQALQAFMALNWGAMK